MRQVTDRATVSRWLAGYEAAWRAPGTGDLADLFTADATYLHSPYERLCGWTLARAEVRYGDPPGQEYRDLWVIRFAGDGRCTWFEEWPYWPGHPYSAGDGGGDGGGRGRSDGLVRIQRSSSRTDPRLRADRP